MPCFARMKRIPNASIYHAVHSMHECQIAIAARLHRWRGGAVWCAMEVAWQQGNRATATLTTVLNISNPHQPPHPRGLRAGARDMCTDPWSISSEVHAPMPGAEEFRHVRVVEVELLAHLGCLGGWRRRRRLLLPTRNILSSGAVRLRPRVQAAQALECFLQHRPPPLPDGVGVEVAQCARPTPRHP